MNLAEHPTVRRFHESQAGRPDTAEPPRSLDAAWLRQLCLDCGADDAGLVEISRPALDDQRADILRYFPHAKTLLSFEGGDGLRHPRLGRRGVCPKALPQEEGQA